MTFRETSQRRLSCLNLHIYYLQIVTWGGMLFFPNFHIYLHIVTWGGVPFSKNTLDISRTFLFATFCLQHRCNSMLSRAF